jgi:hypothetical protein
LQPLYGYALAEYILQQHCASGSGKPLVIYEMGAGNGTLMSNILSWIQRKAPNVYHTMRYNIIEISKQLTERQEWNNMSHLTEQVRQSGRVRIVNKSIFDWSETVQEPCFFIALEVLVRASSAPQIDIRIILRMMWCGIISAWSVRKRHRCKHA